MNQNAIFEAIGEILKEERDRFERMVDSRLGPAGQDLLAMRNISEQQAKSAADLLVGVAYAFAHKGGAE